MNQQTFIIYDFAFFPALLDDYGYYLIRKDLSALFLDNKNIPTTLPSDTDRKPHWKDVLLTDKKLGVVSTIDFLHWEKDKYRVYFDTLRISSLLSARDDTWTKLAGSFMARVALATLSKYGHDRCVHTDYAIVGVERVYRASDEERRGDIKMVRRVCAVMEGKSFLNIETSHGSLYPNLKVDYAGIFQLDDAEKKQYRDVGEKVCDVSLVWQCGVKRRRILREQRIYRWDDPLFYRYFRPLVASPHRSEIIEKMLMLSSEPTKDFMSPLPNELLQKFPWLEKPLGDWVFVDFETDFQKCIYMMGHYTREGGYLCEWSDHLDMFSEKPLMIKIHQLLSQLQQSGKMVCYYVAERNFWKERCRLHNLEGLMSLFDNAVDLSHVFQYGPVIVRGAFNFKLKTLASRLCEMGHLGLRQPQGCADGAESVEIAREYFRSRSENLLSILEAYNQFDCQVLCEMVCFLQEKVIHQ